ncbi:MAG: nucleotidyltransferase family protein [Actinomycetota bacterium]|nr:nucleotidyltransferase family protein [Actinomycetota bacterium]
MSLPELQRAGFATGLTALAAELAAADFTADLQPYLREQRDQVGARVERFRPVVGLTLAALAGVGVPATPVKGAELVNGIWPWPSARPMSDVDVIVPANLRAQASAALVAAGLTFDGASVHEDTFLAWGDGSIGRTDGESVEHNGRVEVHPGWGEFIHGYVVHGLPIDRYTTVRPLWGTDCARLDLNGVTASVIGHLSSTVVRCEVRAVNVIDVWFCDRAGAQWPTVAKLLDECDPRLTGPGLWLASRVLPGVVPAQAVDRQLARLPKAARHRLDGIEPSATLRDPSSRTTFGWRQAFTMRPAERVGVLRQMTHSRRVRR